MSYTITISGMAQPAEGQTPDQADADLTAKARAFVAGLPGVSAAFIQTTTAGHANIMAAPEQHAEAQ